MLREPVVPVGEIRGKVEVRFKGWWAGVWEVNVGVPLVGALGGRRRGLW